MQINLLPKLMQTMKPPIYTNKSNADGMAIFANNEFSKLQLKPVKLFNRNGCVCPTEQKIYQHA